MYNALRLIRESRERKLSKAREQKRLTLERKLNELKAEFERKVIRQQEKDKKLGKQNSTSSLEVDPTNTFPIPGTNVDNVGTSSSGLGPSSSSKVECLAIIEGSPQRPSPTPCSQSSTVILQRSHDQYINNGDDDEGTDEEELQQIRVVSGTFVNKIRYLSVSPVPLDNASSNGSSFYGSESASQINLNSPVFYPKSMSLQGEDRTRSSISASSDRRISTVSFGGTAEHYVEGREDEDCSERSDAGDNTKGPKKRKRSSAKSKGKGHSSFISRNARMTSNMIGSFLIFTGLLTAVLGFLASEDFMLYSPFIMAIGFLLVIGGFIVIFLGNNRLSMIAPKVKYTSKGISTTTTSTNLGDNGNGKDATTGEQELSIQHTPTPISLSVPATPKAEPSKTSVSASVVEKY